MILRYPEPILSQECERVEIGSSEMRALAAELRAEMKACKRAGIGLAAPQIGRSKQAFLIDTKFLNLKCPSIFINPRIVWAGGGEKTQNEGCLSFSDVVSIPVSRFLRVEVHAWDADGCTFEVNLEGMAARCVQHECEHLQGITIWDHATAAQRKAATKKIVTKMKGRARG